MRFNLHCSRLLRKQLEALSCSGKKGVIAANQCVKVLNIIRSEGFHSVSIKGKRTKKGESRVANCVKYDLGHGYRLVTVLKGENLFVTFVGSHDKTDQWLEQNRDTAFKESSQGFESEAVFLFREDNTPVVDDDGDNRLSTESDIYEKYLLSQVDEELLRDIFSGLVGSAQDSEGGTE